MGDWLGTGNVHGRDREYQSFKEARDFVHKLGLKSSTEWKQYCKGELKRIKKPKPEDIPTNPNNVYKDKGWKGYGDWLDTGRASPRRKK